MVLLHNEVGETALKSLVIHSSPYPCSSMAITLWFCQWEPIPSRWISVDAWEKAWLVPRSRLWFHLQKYSYLGLTDSMYYGLIRSLFCNKQREETVQDWMSMEGAGIEAQGARFGGESLPQPGTEDKDCMQSDTCHQEGFRPHVLRHQHLELSAWLASTFWGGKWWPTIRVVRFSK